MAQTTYSPKEVSDLLGVTLAMLRRYSDALETATGVKVARTPRQRVYSDEEVRVLVAARGLLEATTTNLPIDTAIRRVLGTEVTISSIGEGAGVLAMILERLDAQTAAIAELKAEVAALRLEVKGRR